MAHFPLAVTSPSETSASSVICFKKHSPPPISLKLKGVLQLLFVVHFPCFCLAIENDYPSADFPASWVNNDFIQRGSTDFNDGSTVRPVLLNNSNPKNFPAIGCGFYGNRANNSFFFAIFAVQATSISTIITTNSPVVIWTANRANPVRENATLHLTSGRGVVLRDDDGTLVWSSNTSLYRARSMQITGNGTLNLVDVDDFIIWQSMDQPMDTWLPGQTLTSGQRLIASVSATNWNPGPFYLSFVGRDLFAFMDSDPPLMYRKVLQAATASKKFRTGSLDLVDLAVLYVSETEEFQYMRLDSDGHLRVYQWVTGAVVTVEDILMESLDSCDYPTVCGNYGICSSGNCICPGGNDGTGSYFRQMNSNPGCIETTPLSCQSSNLHHLLELDKVSYIGFITKLPNTDIESCKQACLKNCSCKAALFRYNLNSSIGNCSLPSQIFSLMSVARPYNSTTFIKVQKSLVAVAPAPNPAIRTFTPKPSRRKSSWIALILGSTIGALVVAIPIVWICVRNRRRRNRRGKNVDEELDDSLNLVENLPTRFTYEELKSATQNFHRKLGGGGFGSVFEGNLSDGTKIAVKRLDRLGQGRKEFLAEVKTVGSIHHINLVRLMGFCAEKSQRLLVYEYMSNGSLDKWIFHRNPEKALGWEIRKKIILSIAKGLAYLHEDCRTRIAHLDIKPQNILLDDNFNARLSDFGLARLIDRNQSQVITQMRGTRGYMAPEWLSRKITEKVDVFSFGVVVLEIVSGRKNLDFSQPEEIDHLLLHIVKQKAEENQLLDVVDRSSEDMQRQGEEAVKMIKIAIWCLQNDFTRRPSMSMVVKVLEGAMVMEPISDYSFLTSTMVVAHEEVIMAASAPQPAVVLFLYATLDDYPSANVSTSWTSESGITNYDQSFLSLVLVNNTKLLQNFTGVGCGFYGGPNDTGVYDSIFFVIFVSYTSDDHPYSFIGLNSPEIIWTANRANPVKRNATLHLTSEGDLVLRDADGTLAWSTDTSGKSVVGMNLTQSGNLLLYDSNRSIVWQSFDHPTDAWLPGQTLSQGQRLLASVSQTNWTASPFYLSCSSDGLFAFIEANPPQMYSKVVHGGIKSLEFNAGRLDLIKGKSNSTAALYVSKTEDFQFMKLEPGGHLRTYRWTRSQVTNEDILTGTLPDCAYPMVCGNYGICSNGGQCSCPGGNGGDASYFRQLSFRQPSRGCVEVTQLSCQYPHRHLFLELVDVSYFGFVTVFTNTDADNCKEACLKNCSCKAALYRYLSNFSRGDCAMPSQIFSLMNSQQQVTSNTHIPPPDPTTVYSYSAFIKVQKPSPAPIPTLPTKPESAPASVPLKKKTNRIALIMGLIFAASSVFTVLVWIYIRVKRKGRHLQEGLDEDGEEVENSLELLPDLPKRFTYDDLKSATENFQVHRKLGGGGFGSVFEGTLGDGTKVAVKRLDHLGQGRKEFLAEVRTMGSIHHVNLVKLIGFCSERSHTLLVYEYMTNGSLDKLIFKTTPETALEWKIRRKIILDIARGLVYLHEECKKRIAHLDIKPQNILLDDNFNAKLSDFGLARLMDRDQSHVMTQMRGTRGYMAPEWLSKKITEKADVYSFGVVMLEVVCGRKNLDYSLLEENEHLLQLVKKKAEANQLFELLDKCIENTQRHGQEAEEMMRFAIWCLHSDPARRPSMSTVVKVLEGVMVMETISDFGFLVPTATKTPKEAIEVASAPPTASILSGPR
ncbi:hypothetical protein F0562_024679 [Nyssa sinensis]|uniref:non-specific serine/threonine protein kinase n=1 Tax=Nyssa sinensis TaxID=561372 RepID=A0A5J5BF00_9ASTE|nr:hypothetical protein F0562_024679 [Nyssa sinensis]